MEYYYYFLLEALFPRTSTIDDPAKLFFFVAYIFHRDECHSTTVHWQFLFFSSSFRLNYLSNYIWSVKQFGVENQKIKMILYAQIIVLFNEIIFSAKLFIRWIHYTSDPCFTLFPLFDGIQTNVDFSATRKVMHMISFYFSFGFVLSAIKEREKNDHRINDARHNPFWVIRKSSKN